MAYTPHHSAFGVDAPDPRHPNVRYRTDNGNWKEHRTRELALFKPAEKRAGHSRGKANMLSWIILGLVGWALGFLFVMVLMRISADEDRAARHQQKRLDPYSDVSITAIRHS